MENKKYFDDYQKTIKVLNSCLTMEQVNIADNYFNLFLKKWYYSFSEKNYLTIIYHYNKLKNEKQLFLFKNKLL